MWLFPFMGENHNPDTSIYIIYTPCFARGTTFHIHYRVETRSDYIDLSTPDEYEEAI